MGAPNGAPTFPGNDGLSHSVLLVIGDERKRKTPSSKICVPIHLNAPNMKVWTTTTGSWTRSSYSRPQGLRRPVAAKLPEISTSSETGQLQP